MSPRAAWRLESLGFREVYDYVAGEADWTAFGLPTEGAQAGLPRAGTLAQRDWPTCHLSDALPDVFGRMAAADRDACAVINAEGVVLGLVRWSGSDVPSGTTVESFMEVGPSTFRPSAPPDEPLTYMRRRNRNSVLVTFSDGRLVGVLSRSDAEQAARSGDSE